MNLIPLVDHILVEPTQAETTTASGIILPTDDKEKPSKGKVIALPKDGKYIKDGLEITIDLAIWDTVYFTKYAPDELELNGKKYLVIKHSSLLAKESA
jgi:chaperonin GroES